MEPLAGLRRHKGVMFEHHGSAVPRRRVWGLRSSLRQPAFAALLAAAVLLAGCSSTSAAARMRSSRLAGGASQATTSTSSSTASGRGHSPGAGGQPIRAKSSHGLLTWRGLAAPAVADTTLGLYLTSQVSPLGSAPIIDELARVDRATGDVVAQRRLSGSFDSAIAASGSLWVTTTSRSPVGPGLTSEVVWRLDPRTLAVRSRRQVTASKGLAGYVGGSMAVAGGGLWVTGGNRLLRLSLHAGQVVASVPLLGAASSDVASNATGTVLIVGEAASSGVGSIERRDPVTGALIATAPRVIGVVAPRVGGVIDGLVWVSEATGMMGYVQRYDLTPLAPAGRACSEGKNTGSCVGGTNGIRASVADGLVWIAQAAGGPTRQVCLDPTSGRVLSSLPLAGNDALVAIGIHHLYVLEPTAPTVAGQSVTQVPIPHACAAS